MRGRIKVRLRRKHNCTRFSGNGAVSNHGNVREGEQTPLLGKSLAGNLQFAESFYPLVGVALARAAGSESLAQFAPSEAPYSNTGVGRWVAVSLSHEITSRYIASKAHLVHKGLFRVRAASPLMNMARLECLYVKTLAVNMPWVGFKRYPNLERCPLSRFRPNLEFSTQRACALFHASDT
jgi:hypothetical protein